jgi:hypothetical protein
VKRDEVDEARLERQADRREIDRKGRGYKGGKGMDGSKGRVEAIYIPR